MASHELDDDDTALVMLLCGGGLPVVLGILARTSEAIRGWLISHAILVEADVALWVIPGVNAGLDFLRIVFVAAFLGLFVVVPVLTIRSRRAARR